MGEFHWEREIMSNALSLSSMLGEADVAGWVFMKAVSDDLTELSPESVKLFHDISLKRNDMKMTVLCCKYLADLGEREAGNLAALTLDAMSSELTDTQREGLNLLISSFSNKPTESSTSSSDSSGS